jgi:hypothetical protein
VANALARHERLDLHDLTIAGAAEALVDVVDD